jgi:hypothetical protein
MTLLTLLYKPDHMLAHSGDIPLSSIIFYMQNWRARAWNPQFVTHHHDKNRPVLQEFGD